MRRKIGLALSGGGFRATLFNLGSLIRLNELGILRKLSRITSVSGGSIATGVLAMNWKNLKFEKNGMASNFDTFVTEPIWDFCSESFDILSVAKGLAHPFKSIPTVVADVYSKRLFKSCNMDDVSEIPGAPQFLFYGTSLQTGSPIRMVDGLFYDHKIGAIEIGDWSLARVVGISSSFPPFLAPVSIKIGYKRWHKAKHQKVFNDIQFKKKLHLLDGGVYDNMGIESLWKKSSGKLADSENELNKKLNDDIDFCLVSDAGAPMNTVPKPWKNWLSLSFRTLNQTIEQSRAVRKRWLVKKFLRSSLKGAYWGITTKIQDYQFPSALKTDCLTTAKLQKIPTRLSRISDNRKSRLINWGYALADAALNTHCKEIICTQNQGSLPFEDH